MRESGEAWVKERIRGNFPAQFRWGVATSSYQIEGAVTEDGRGESIWDRFSHTPGHVVSGETGDVACDHYHRFRQDIALMRELGIRSYRFSIAWPRVVPLGKGRAEERGLAFYDRLVDALLEAGIAPLATLYHWDLPQALQDQGGWLTRDTAEAFADYAATVGDRLGDRIPEFATHNEPWCTAVLGHETGMHAPGIRRREAALRAAHHVLLSHGLAARALRAARSETRVGIVLNMETYYPASDRPEDEEAVHRADVAQNRWYLDPVTRGSYPESIAAELEAIGDVVQSGDLEVVAQPLDFLGVNNYSSSIVAGEEENGNIRVRNVTPHDHVTDMDWPIVPDGLRDLLVHLSRDVTDVPLFVTENGAAFPDQVSDDGKVHDPKRIEYLAAHIDAVGRAIDEGARVQGYYLWSLLDNFEWSLGYSKRFGIVYTDVHQPSLRIPKDSARWYAAWIEHALARAPLA